MHGGDIYRNNVRYDFSVNVNPLGMPGEMKEAIEGAMAHLGEYPDPEAAAVKQTIAGRIGVPASFVIPGNGASEIFMAAVHALQPPCALLLAPSFSGYEYALRSLPGCRIHYHMLREEQDFALDESYLDDIRALASCGMKEQGGDARDDGQSTATPVKSAAGRPMAFLACPNNPNGKLVPMHLLEKIIRCCEENRIVLVLDECFLDFSEQIYEYRKMLADIRTPYLIRVLAYTKICAIPGVRLGFAAVSDETLHKTIQSMLPEWNLSAFAQAAGSAEYDEQEWIRKTQEHLRKEKQYLINVLTGEPLIRETFYFKVFPSDANYLLLYTEYPLYKKMLERGILIRNCADYPGLKEGFYRIAVLSHPENRIFAGELRSLTQKD